MITCKAIASAMRQRSFAGASTNNRGIADTTSWKSPNRTTWTKCSAREEGYPPLRLDQRRSDCRSEAARIPIPDCRTFGRALRRAGCGDLRRRRNLARVEADEDQGGH